jgi:hypothetical protein
MLVNSSNVKRYGMKMLRQDGFHASWCNAALLCIISFILLYEDLCPSH